MSRRLGRDVDGRGKWLSKPAVLWALDEAPDVPERLVSTLIAVARYADPQGRGAHPSTETIAKHTRKSRRQARRDLDKLEELKLLVPGDEQIVSHIRADRRPVVYDLPMPHPVDNSQRGVADDPSSEQSGGTSGALRGDTSPLNGGSPVTPEEILKGSRKARRANGAAAPRAANPKKCASCGRTLRSGHTPDCTESTP